MKPMIVILFFLLMAPTVFAGEADVVDARVEHRGDGYYSFFVSVRHGDEGWDHYADKWEVLGPDGKLLATRVLHHPHVDEQPFTRSLGGIKIDPGIKQVTIRAHDSVHGFGGKTQVVVLPR